MVTGVPRFWHPRTANCAAGGHEFLRTSPAQRFCPDCALALRRLSGAEREAKLTELRRASGWRQYSAKEGVSNG